MHHANHYHDIRSKEQPPVYSGAAAVLQLLWQRQRELQASPLACFPSALLSNQCNVGCIMLIEVWIVELQAMEDIPTLFGILLLPSIVAYDGGIINVTLS